ncbi:hypothetical protein lpari_03388 [Legionella parisiensis]|uniref:Uncharacterized protein n=1 Tax=Legionella parisiensis TaxID=45071 RepID=A0A1E5JMG4_9GAMM|nr:hypothetical protein lpari_03388 [Legionella parisiensis]STX71706.1 Uncharacterised protein [Legionella parisiensis]
MTLYFEQNIFAGKLDKIFSIDVLTIRAHCATRLLAPKIFL